MAHEEYKDLLTAQALNTLDSADERNLRDHLRVCDECQSELVAWRDSAALLAYAAEASEPSRDLRARLLTALKHESPPPARIVEMPARRTNTLWPLVLRIAAAVIVVALIGTVFWLWRREVMMRREMVRLNREVATQQRELARSRDNLAHQRDLVALLTSPNARKMEMIGTATAQKARGTFVFDQQTGAAMLMTESLPAPPADKAYELWFIPHGHLPMAGKVFTVDASGKALVSDLMPPEAREKAVIAITLEPKHGSSQPTGAIYLNSPG